MSKCQATSCIDNAACNYNGELLCKYHAYLKFSRIITELDIDYQQAKAAIEDRYAEVMEAGLTNSKRILISSVSMIFIAMPFIVILAMFATWLLTHK